ncbi:MAG TPA: hypothetical protein VJ999_01025 [Candidatus Sulfotelmatobacter sp.]|nr:hypothetical protein [Candidatus Sulfotelmatobacter sp.]
MLRISKTRQARVQHLLLAAVAALLMTQDAITQDDPNDAPLGDVARNFRKKPTPGQDVIDNDNLPKVMEQVESHHTPGSALKFLMAGESKSFRVATPDATCSLSFTANAKSLLSGQYSQMDLPPGEMLKLEGPATIEGDSLIVSVFNGTDWHVSEVAVALTVVRKSQPRDAALSYGSAKLVPAVAGSVAQESDVRPEKKPDVTVIYRMRAAAAPSTTTVFSARLNLDLAPGEEWHWALVRAKGYPPQSYAGTAPQTTAQTRDSVTAQPTLPPALDAPQTSGEAARPQAPQ